MQAEPEKAAAETQTFQKIFPLINHSTFIPNPHYMADIAALESFFQNAKLPIGPIRFLHYGIIANPADFVASHIAAIKANNGNRTFAPFIERLDAFKNLIMQ